MAAPQFVLLDEAAADLVGIAEYPTLNAGTRIAERNLARILTKLHALVDFPFIGRVRTDIAGAPRNFAIALWIVFYESQATGGIVVWRVVHGRRDLSTFVRRGGGR